MLACHKIVTSNCQKVHGSGEAAVDVALADIKKLAYQAVNGWGTKANIHIKVEVERLDLDEGGGT